MDYSELGVFELEDFLYLEEQQPRGSWEKQSVFGDGLNNSVPSLFECDKYLLPYQKSNPSSYELIDFEEISGDFDLWDSLNLQSLYNEIDVEAKPLNTALGDPRRDNVLSEAMNVVYGRELSVPDRNKGITRVRRYKSCALELDEIQKYFGVPISEAAKELNVGLTVLKKRCRELNIMRWPHRKIKSIKCLIDNVKELGLTNEIEMLEEHKRKLEQLPEMELTERTKKLRQACFKANYKKRRSMQASFA
ncbi:protein RKD3 [Olea europaea var. sylvestris]|uniref:protein RKD3 n=1 Tax=Olea europaea var. sylvestris TaxID=158386 RepID=UPI000C1CFFC5|nr:protein RKD3 [Olea europaea var. sylvestris]